MNKQKLLLKQIDTKLEPWIKLGQQERPNKGWLHTIRQALGMTTTKLAQRLGINQSRIIQLEQAEANDSITLRTLSKAAEAMGCRFIYALVPKDSLENILRRQARILAEQQLERIHHSMLLEQQSVSPEQKEEQLNRLTEELFQALGSQLWNEWEQANILEAQKWLMHFRGSILTETFLLNLHKKMFDETWKWAGQFRKTNKNIGCEWQHVPVQLKLLLVRELSIRAEYLRNR